MLRVGCATRRGSTKTYEIVHGTNRTFFTAEGLKRACDESTAPAGAVAGAAAGFCAGVAGAGALAAGAAAGGPVP